MYVKVVGETIYTKGPLNKVDPQPRPAEVADLIVKLTGSPLTAEETATFQAMHEAQIAKFKATA